MRRQRTLRIAGALVLLALMGGMFVRVIWIPLYGQRRAGEFAAAQEEPALQADIVREDGAGSRSWSLQDRQALARLRDGLRRVEFAPGAEPKADQRYTLRIRRADARVDEYEVLLDNRGSEHDLLYVVRRSGGSAIYGSAFKTPELRSALQQVLRDPQVR